MQRVMQVSAGIDPRASFNESRYDFGVPSICRLIQRVAAPSSRRANVGAGRDERFGDFGMPMPRRPM